MIQLLESMLNILKRKSASKYFYFLLKLSFSVVFVFSIINLVFACNMKQGAIFDVKLISKIDIGMSKEDVIALLGEPMFTSSHDYDCLCYYFYSYPWFMYFKISRRYLVLFFEDSNLKEYFFRL